MKNWFINRWTSLKNAALYVRGVFSLKLTILYAAMTGLCWYADIGPIHFIGLVGVVLLIDCISYAQGVRVERDIQNRVRIKQ